MIEKCKHLFSLQGFYGILLSLLLKIISSQLVVLDSFGLTHLNELFDEVNFVRQCVLFGCQAT